MSKHSEAVAKSNAARGKFVSGLPDSPMVQRWNRIMKRCYSTKDASYKFYGARGIYVDASWHSAAQFISDMGLPEEGMTVERIDNNGPYSKENCRWATRKEQGQNTRKTKLLTFDGITMNMRDWGARLGVSHASISSRLRNGESFEAIVNRYTEKLERGA